LTLAYLPMALDYVHIGHINIINVARSYHPDHIMIGLVSDRMMDRYKDRHHDYERRWELATMIKYVDWVIKEDTEPLFLATIQKWKPTYVIHGDDWARPGAPLYQTRCEIKDYVRAYGGILIEPKYTKGVSSTKIRDEK
jgi:phosphoenolpyruvate phosphomutase